MGIFDGIKKMVGGAPSTELLAQENDKQLKQYMQEVEKINALEGEYEKLSNEELKAKTGEFQQRLKNGASLDSLLVEAFAVVREASWRVLELRHYDVQLIGGMALHDGRLAEMATGEGKTLVALLPVYLNALSSQSAFVVTTNDYLARRDGETMGQVHRFLGLSVGIVQSFHKEQQRKDAYNSDVTYVSNQELGFDFLRDNLAMSVENVVQQKPYNFCVVDEADSILVDEARTPLIISRKGQSPTSKYVSSAQIVKNLKETEHYVVNLKDQKVELTPTGFKFAEQIVGKGLFDLKDPWAFYIINALKAKEIFKVDRDYIVQNGAIAIIDAFSGRVLDGRRFTDGVQQSIEAKEALQVTGETEVVAKVTYQNLFRLFPKLSGMTGTAFTEAEEFMEVYQLKVLPIPTALPVARRDNDDAVFKTQDGKMKAMLTNIVSTNKKGRPILIGTTSVEASEEVFSALNDLGVDARLLNAKPENIERESEIVAQAGRLGAVTVATNMAGRGTDILLGGSAKGTASVLAKHLLLVKLGLTEAPQPGIAAVSSAKAATPAVSATGEISALDDGAEAEEGSFAAAVKDGPERPPQAEEEESEGATEASEEEEEDIIETDPDVLSLPDINDLAKHLDFWLPKKLKKKTDIALKRAVISCVDLLGESAGRLDVEDVVAQASDSAPVTEQAIKLLRAALQMVTKEFDTVVKAERQRVQQLGGLYVIGTSRHESRRIDNQLRGRAGRQGDPGGTRFFLSLEDDMFKIFGADKMAGLMENFRVAEDMPIESDLVTQALDKVQIQVEDYMRANRQQVFKLDDVTSSQRAVVYSQRRAFLSSSEDGMLETFTKYSLATMNEIYEAALVPPQKGKAAPGGPVDAQKLVTKAMQFFPNIKLSVDDVSSTPPAEVSQMLQARLLDAIQEKRRELDNATSWPFVSFFRYLAIVQTDESWCRHLSRLDLLKEEMVLQSFTAEKDVMETYRERALQLFDSLMDEVRRNAVYSLFIYKPQPAPAGSAPAQV
jgi:preprotein translocase subunit SecA